MTTCNCKKTNNDFIFLTRRNKKISFCKHCIDEKTINYLIKKHGYILAADLEHKALTLEILLDWCADIFKENEYTVKPYVKETIYNPLVIEGINNELIHIINNERKLLKLQYNDECKVLFFTEDSLTKNLIKQSVINLHWKNRIFSNTKCSIGVEETDLNGVLNKGYKKYSFNQNIIVNNKFTSETEVINIYYKLIQ
jgi:hypothetical protein